MFKIKAIISSTAIKGCVLIGFLVICAVFSNIPAQTANQGFSVGSKESFDSYGDVSLYDGSLNFDLPLLNIGGRGSVSYSPTLKLSAEWEIETVIDDYNPNPNPDFYYYPIYKGTNDPGYNNYRNPVVGYGPGVLIIKRDYTYSEATGSATSLTRLYFYGPGGGRMELRDVAFQGKRHATSLGNTTNRGKRFGSNDGSAVTFISDADIFDRAVCPSNNSNCAQPNPYAWGYLKFANGTEYRIDGGAVTSIRDSDGNKMQFTYHASGVQNPDGSVMAGQVNTVTDSNGRTVQFEYSVQDIEPFGACDRIIYKGFAGGTRIVRISRKQLGSVLRSGQTIKPIYQLFPSSDGAIGGGSANFNNQVISAVWLPDGKSYKFRYNSYGELARTELPAGGAIEYDYTIGGGGDIGGFVRGEGSGGAPAYISRSVAERRTYREGNVLEKRENYEIQSGCSLSGCESWNLETMTKLEVFDGQSGVKLQAVRHWFYGSAELSYLSTDDYSPWRTGKEYKTEALDLNNNVLKRTETDWQQRAYVSWWNEGCTFQCPSHEASPAVDPRVLETRNIDVPTNQVTKTRFGYDEFNNQTDVWSYDFGQGQAGGLLRYVHTDFLRGEYISNLYASSPHIRRLPERQWISSDELGNSRLALTEYEYDNYSYSANHAPLVLMSNVVGHNSAIFNTTYTQRGNATKVTNYQNAQNQTGAISAYSQYDILGNIVKTIDAKGGVSTTDYADNFGSPDTEARANTSPAQLNGLYTFAYPTRSTNPLGWLSGYSQRDYFTGAVVNEEDINGAISKTLYDSNDRLTQNVSAVGTLYECQRNTIYDDANRRIEVKKDLYALNDNLEKTESFYDGLGRTIETREYETGGYISKLTQFNALGKTKKTSDPYRPLTGEQPVWTEYSYDFLGRPTQTKTPDNLMVLTEYVGKAITVTDQSGRKRRSIADALERVIRVDEPNEQGALGSIESPNQPSNYLYTSTGSLVKVTQGTQNRYFLYNSLGQLIRVRQPEQGTNPNLTMTDSVTGNSQWSTGSTYDALGEVLTVTDAKGATITNTYDSLSRAVSRTYSDNTPAVSYTYDDVNVAFSKGRLTKISNGISISENTSFDKVGRLLTYRQTTDGKNYDTSYLYNLSGALIEQTYPSGRKVKNTFDANGNLETVKSQKTAESALRIYARNFVRNASGAITSMRLGNGLYETAKLNNRSQIIELGLGTTSVNTNLWKINYDYGLIDNNGNIKSQTINTGTTTFVQTYLYDSLNRLTEAKEVTGAQQTWKQNFGYDKFGNRTQFAQIVGTQQLVINNLTLPQVDVASNRFVTGQGYEYDLNGNLTKNAQGLGFIFDGNNKQTEVKDAANVVIGLYFYDGNGKRVKKVTAEETVIFVYDSTSKLIAEHSTKNVVNPKISYLTRDHLGTPRVITDQNRQVISRRDHMPFGENITANRSTTDKYGAEDNVRQGFTGYQKDKETGLDFAEARYYYSNHGRFTAVDPLLASGKGPNPQTFNRYVYCLNRPIVAIDPSGLSTIIIVVDKSKNAKVIWVDKNISTEFKAWTGGTGARSQEDGDTPFGVYKFDKTQGGKNTGWRDDTYPTSYGTGKIKLIPVEGEVVKHGRTGIHIHGGGGVLPRLKEDPYAPYQRLTSTIGCIRMHNADVNTLIGLIQNANQSGDPLDFVFIGDKETLKELANRKVNGKYVYPQLKNYRDKNVEASGGLGAILSINLTQDATGIEGDEGDDDEFTGNSDDLYDYEDVVEEDSREQPPSTYG